MEKSLAPRDCLLRMISADDTESAAVYLREYGLELTSLDAEAREDVLVSALGQGISEIEKSAPSPEIFAFFRYPYDCSNVKSLIKCRARGIDPDKMLFGIGSAPVKTLKDGFERNDFSALPEAMAKAAPEAEKAYAETKNPCFIDFILDRACFEDMASLAKRCELPFVKAIVDSRADMTNFMIALRVLRMNRENYANDLLNSALVEGGKIGKENFKKAAALGEDELIALAKRAGYSKLSKLATGTSLSEAERLCDNEKLAVISAGRRKTFGAEIPLAFIAALEAQIQNIRIVLAGKDAGIPSETISERIRDLYV